eukprot:Rmarinus@m.9666
MGGDDADHSAPTVDNRMDWVEKELKNVLKVQPKQFRSDDNIDNAKRFLDEANEKYLLVYSDGKEWFAKGQIPTDAKRNSKAALFFKLEAIKIDPEAIASQVQVRVVQMGTTQILEFLMDLSKNTFLPIIQNPKLQEVWPDVIVKEVMHNYHQFLANLYVTVGLTKGKTLLPLPSDEYCTNDSSAEDKDHVHLLESALVGWTKQINSVLKSDPEAALKQGENVGAHAEIEFWKHKAENLNLIHSQLESPQVQKLFRILDLAKSTYLPAFQRLIRDVNLAREEANDNNVFLSPLEQYFDKIISEDGLYQELLQLYTPLMHSILLVWKHSRHYNTPVRLVVVMRQICNDLITRSCSNLVAEELFQVEPHEAVDRLKLTIDTLTSFRNTYFEYKAKASAECPNNPWRFQNSALFARLDTYLERCYDLLDLMQTILLFNQLERIEIGGTKGRILTMSVKQIHTDFQNAVSSFQSVTYDVLDVDQKQFDEDFYHFRASIKELDRRLASVICQAFDDCTTVYGCFKLLDSFEGLLDREIIQHDMEKKHTALLHAYGADLRECLELFNQGKDSPYIDKNKPPSAGSVNWARGLLERVEEPYQRFLQFNNTTLLETEEFKEIQKQYTMLSAALRDFEHEKVELWSKEVADTSQAKLRLPLLTRDANTGLLSVNFDPALVRLLREVKYMKLLRLDVPHSALDIYKEAERFRKQTGNLDIIVNMYNKMQTTVLPVERPLFKTKLEAIDKELNEGLKNINWKNPNIDGFIKKTHPQVQAADNNLRIIKQNVTKIEGILEGWAKTVLLERRDQKTYAIEEFKAQQDTLCSTRYQEITQGGREIAMLLKESYEHLKVSRGAQHWKHYEQYVNDIVISGFRKTVVHSLAYLVNQVDSSNLSRNDIYPLLEIKLELLNQSITYTPPMSSDSSDDPEQLTIKDLVELWIKTFLGAAELMQRLDNQEQNYLSEVEEYEEVKELVGKVRSLVSNNQAECIRFRDSYLEFEYLWKKDLQASFTEFLEGHIDSDGKPRKPTLAEFDEQIQKYKSLHEKIQHLPTTHTIGWLKIDCKPIKQSLSTWVTKWMYMYTQHLSQKVRGGMEDLYKFMELANVVLEKEVPEGEPELLMEVLQVIIQVRDRTDDTDNMFGPLRDTVGLLKKYDVNLMDSVLVDLESAPLAWNNVKKLQFNAKERLNPLQTAEAEKIKQKGERFNDEVRSFREGFMGNKKGVTGAPFAFNERTDDAYKVLDSFNHELQKLEGKSNKFNELQTLFELNVSSYREIKDSRKELAALKQVWDMTTYVLTTFDEWKKTPWAVIDTDYLGDAAKILQNQVRALNKAVKSWHCYKGLEDCVKNMLTSLPLVQDLHHPSMRDRHWKQLMKATGVSFQMDDNFCLEDLLALKLHQYVDQVTEIVDRAQKELIIEKNLEKIDTTWEALALEFVEYGEGDLALMILATPEAVVEALEDNQVQLQNMQASKYVANNEDFMERVNSWQKKLGQVDSVLTYWLDVQKKWTGLESIFLGSADIREQLPEDSRRFEEVDKVWRVLMAEAQNVTSVIDACHISGREDLLKNNLEKLEMCEKSLADYLETKRLAYPRFYFVASADLLDILSKGSNPLLIQKHLSKCFDNIQALEFQKDEDGEPTNVAVGMYSKENEYAPYSELFTCEGPVEGWLRDLTTAMQKNLQATLRDALRAYEDPQKPRHLWIFDWPAGVAIVATRIVFTEDVNLAFDDLENGNENALKDYREKLQVQLDNLSDLILQDQTSNDRRKLITLVTVDVHARDVVSKMITDKCEDSTVFQWQSQLRYHMIREDENAENPDNANAGLCRINICDFSAFYGYEYIGNAGCLVITPLTDRCYITLTQASNICLGGAPAGPAGTGKTETVKDLSRALGYMVYVFNCSDQMDYKIMGQIYKGLAQTGAWGCFDEFNRIPVEVLSVCSTQYKCVLDAIRANKDKFEFEGEVIPLRPTVMAFITMNPGYAGRAELPESLKALFRPVSMIVPDMDLITEIMLMSEGFKEAKLLARKFMILYRLCEDLLSKQMHYDWKLRAIKTTLNVAGGMKRSAPELSEDKVLLRALRDFNIGKLVRDDVEIFFGLLNDLFPKTLELVQRARDPDFEETIRKACSEMGLQADETFVLKVTQLREILSVRWSIFVLGPAGCAKTQLWKALLRSQNMFGEKSTYQALNPKGVTRNELYGYISPATREWKDGLISQIFRDMANNKTYEHEWIILDGDIDAEWIESMNTVMDDNKMLTLASNERIPLTAPMRLLFEIGDLRNASPATVSRAGVIFLNATDLGWQPMVQSWIDDRDSETERAELHQLFEKYVPPTLEHLRRSFKFVTALVDMNMVDTLCRILEGMLDEHKVENRGARTQAQTALLETQFVFAAVWAFGGCLLVDKTADYRISFSKWWREEFKTIRFPEGGLVFDYAVEVESIKFSPWAEQVPEYAHNPEVLFGNIYVETVDTVRLSYLLEVIAKRRHSVMFVGNAGTGKTAIVRQYLKRLNPDSTLYTMMNLNCFTDSMAMQSVMEGPLEKKTGRMYGPPGTRKLIYFVDDMNMPFVDKYGTQSAIALLRQHFDYKMVYDRVKLQQKDIQNVQYLACMNPTAGSFSINPRAQRHFSTFGLQMPVREDLHHIYYSILKGHLGNFKPEVAKWGEKIMTAALDLHLEVANFFLPSAVKFHYQFNLRDLSNVVQGVCASRNDCYVNPLDLVRLWLHESERTYADRLISQADTDRFMEMARSTVTRHFDELNSEDVLARPNIFVTFASGSQDESPPYLPVTDFTKLGKVLEEKLQEHNECNAQMNLVLFEQAMAHICRCVRVIERPRGNALCVGVGGSGKQSLARLASFICNYEVFQITVTSSYGPNDFKLDLQNLYVKSGVKCLGMTFLLTDSQIVDDKFLVYMNDFLSSGDVPDLFPPEEKDNIINSVRGEVKSNGIEDTRENCWDYYIERVRRYLHVVLCFSPVGDWFRVRARQFPALTNCTVMDWFQPWPMEALVAVAIRFLNEVENIDEDLRKSVAEHMAFAHEAVNEASIRYIEQERRYNYTTPKSFLELIALYKKLLATKRGEIADLKERLVNGLEKLEATESQVAELQENLKQDQIVVEEKKAATDELLQQVGKEQAEAEKQQAIAAEEEAKCATIQSSVMDMQQECERELSAAEPILEAAAEALNSLDKNSLTELKALGKPSEDIVACLQAVMCLATPGGKPIAKDPNWNTCKKFMGDVGQFLGMLQTFDKDNVPERNVSECERLYCTRAGFDPDSIRSKSVAASGLCGWIVNICKYYRVYQVVKPKREALAKANEDLEGANKALSKIRATVQELEDRLAKLTEAFEQATNDKNIAIAQAEATQRRANLAERLINGLADEKVRWSESIERFSVTERTMIGDVLLSSAFVSYIGAFNASFRNQLVSERWVPDLLEKEIPMTDNVEPLDILTDASRIAQWGNEGLPADRVSIENGAIVTNSSRWPLLIDPQLQGIAWIRAREEQNNLRIVQLSQHKYLDAIELAMTHGHTVIIENLGQSIDAVLDPVISRSTIRRGRQVIVKLGDKEVEYDPNFKLFLQTKLSNPHYKPEVAAQCTLVNFTVTEKGLEDQLLAMVVNKERPDLEQQRADLLRQQNEFKIKLKELEDNLLYNLSNAEGDILANVELIENLEITKSTAKEISEKVEEAKIMEENIATMREVYRPVATRGALLYFLVDQLWILDHMYRFAMANFVTILKKGMDLAEQPEDPEDKDQRVKNLIDTSCFTVFSYCAAGLFEKHKLVFATQLTIRVLMKMGEIDHDMFQFLLKGPKRIVEDNPCSDWMSDDVWGSLLELAEIEPFSAICDDINGSSKRWKEWTEVLAPENEPLPGDWKKIPEFQKLLIIRSLRPDRMTEALATFVKGILGQRYVTSEAFNLAKSFEDAAPDTPVFFFLSAGVNAAASVEALGKVEGFLDRFANVSLGQGQEPIAEHALESAHKNGGWVMLQNIHLTPKWTGGSLEKRLDKIAEGAHPEFRLFLSAEPSEEIPISILQMCIKLTNEPPEGLKENLKRAMNLFSDDVLENCTKQAEFKSITFALAFFHAILLERKKFGPQGWNMNYPFNQGDLTNCVLVCNNYLENNAKIPWDDLRYIFGEIMYGGHIVDNWDRRLCGTYLLSYMRDELLENDAYFTEGFDFKCPPPMSIKGYLEYIEEMPPETPIAFGMHPNAEIGYRLLQADTMFRNMNELQPRSASGGGGMGLEEKTKMVLDDIMDRLPPVMNPEEIREKIEDLSNPYTNVFLQEIDRMIALLTEIRRTLSELDLGLKGDLTISDAMDQLMNCLFMDIVPAGWEKKAYPSLRPLGSWMHNLIERYKQLEEWTNDVQLPKTTWISGLFNPQSFLTAVMQTTARRNDWPLDKTTIVTEVTKKLSAEDVQEPARDGTFVWGFSLEGARWDEKANTLEDSRPKELYSVVPIVNIKAITVDKAESRDVYRCPVYKTQKRGNTYVFTAGLRSKAPPSKWVLGGVCFLMDVVTV